MVLSLDRKRRLQQLLFHRVGVGAVLVFLFLSCLGILQIKQQQYQQQWTTNRKRKITPSSYMKGGASGGAGFYDGVVVTAYTPTNNRHRIGRYPTTFHPQSPYSTLTTPPVVVIGSQRRSSSIHQHQRNNIQVLLTLSNSNSNNNNNNYNTKNKNDEEMDLDTLVAELKLYLQKRKELQVDEVSKENVGKVVGGTKGNVVLDYISGSPNKEMVIDRPSYPFDYEELTKYGYGYLITPIMKQGGRLRMYELLGLQPPPPPPTPVVKDVPKLVIDREGKTDQARYSGLKLTQILDDNIQAQTLRTVQEKVKNGEELRPKLVEELYIPPFQDEENVKKLTSTAKWTPDWTVERLDEYNKQRGKAQSWARAARLGEFVQDPDEGLDLSILPFNQRLYSIAAATLVAFAFGKSSYTFLYNILAIQDDATIQTFLRTLQLPAATLAVGSIGSAVLCSKIASSDKNRNGFVWSIKGFLGGPFTIQYLQSLRPLQTRQQQLDGDDTK